MSNVITWKISVQSMTVFVPTHVYQLLSENLHYIVNSSSLYLFIPSFFDLVKIKRGIKGILIKVVNVSYIHGWSYFHLPLTLLCSFSLVWCMNSITLSSSKNILRVQYYWVISNSKILCLLVKILCKIF